MPEVLRAALALLLALGCVVVFDRRSRRLDLDPPGFRDPIRRALGLSALTVGLAVSALAPLAALGAGQREPVYADVPVWALFMTSRGSLAQPAAMTPLSSPPMMKPSSSTGT